MSQYGERLAEARAAWRAAAEAYENVCHQWLQDFPPREVSDLVVKAMCARQFPQGYERVREAAAEVERIQDELDAVAHDNHSAGSQAIALMRMPEMPPDILEAFTDVMVEKSKILHGERGRDPEDILREIVQLVIVDTELLVSGRVPLQRWLDPGVMDD